MNKKERIKLFDRYIKFCHEISGIKDNSFENQTDSYKEYFLRGIFENSSIYHLNPTSYYDLELKLSLRGF